MSRIGKKPVPVPSGVSVTIDGQTVKVKGSKGEMQARMVDLVNVKHENDEIVVSPVDQSKPARSAWGLSRTLIANLITGVTDGFTKKLEINGVGYNAQLAGNLLKLQVGFANTIELTVPSGITCEVPQPTNVIVSGADKQKVGQFAAEIRRVRPPEPYKLKGIKYEGEYVRRKAGKAFGAK